MPPSDRSEYFARRAAEERQRAERAELPAARVIHNQLAENYSRIARESNVAND
ncbi:hypothetical protein [Sphingomonas koreensis]|uniref:hypothetical protein n=1 Tax=Sphingomonas koreensis TaxID=93064 RepID=UPI0013DFB396|nr:hypothetical protein [Sphingomonas koreensis]